MKKNNKTVALLFGLSLISGLFSCTRSENKVENKDNKEKDSLTEYVANRLPIYEKVRLTTNLNDLTVSERNVLPLLIEAAKIMDDLYWKQAYPQRDSLLNTIKDEKTKQFVMINYGPWDRLNGDKPFNLSHGP